MVTVTVKTKDGDQIKQIFTPTIDQVTGILDTDIPYRRSDRQGMENFINFLKNYIKIKEVIEAYNIKDSWEKETSIEEDLHYLG